MAENPPGYYTGIIHELLLTAFTADDLRRFCQDHPLLRPVVDRFGPKHNLEEMVAEAIDYCETQHLPWVRGNPFRISSKARLGPPPGTGA